MHEENGIVYSVNPELYENPKLEYGIVNWNKEKLIVLLIIWTKIVLNIILVKII